MAMQAPAGVPPPAALAPLPPPHVAHMFTRVTIPGEDDALDYVAVAATAGVVKGLPDLGWKDSSAQVAGSRAAPLLSIAAQVCLPVFLEDPNSPLARTIRALSEVTVVPTLLLLGRCADTCESLRLFAVPLTRSEAWDDKLAPALARIPHPSPFALAAGEMVEANPFEITSASPIELC
jgi:hypothetical protein